VSAGTVGGLVGGLITERTAAAWGPFAVLLLLAAASVAAAYQMHRLGGRVAPSLERELPPELAPQRTDSGVRVLANAPFLRNLAALVLLSALSAALLDFLFKSQAVNAIAAGEPLLRFFAWYYAAAGVLVFVVQLGAYRLALDRLGLARTVMAPAVAVVAGGLGALAFPGLAGITAARGAESVLRGSLFRSAYEIFFTPVPVADKRAAKSLIDVGVDRIGEAAGAGLIALVVAGFASRWQYPLLLMLAVAASMGAVLVARRLTRGYVDALERSLRERAVALSPSDVRDRTTRAVWHTMMTSPAATATGVGVDAGSDTPPAANDVFDQDVLQILALRSRQIERVERVLSPRHRLSPALVAHVIALLDSPALAGLAAQALTAAADEHAGALTDALLDERRPAGIRRRIARVIAGNPTQRGADGLLSALSHRDFSVRVQCGLALAQIQASHPELSVDSRVVLAAVLSELSQGRVVWESHRSVPDADGGEPESFLDEYVRKRAHQGMAHVFTLLSIVLPREPLRIAYRGLHTDDSVLRGTSIEYLESVLPADVREALWPFIEDGRVRPPMAAPRAEVLARLVQAHPSILINLQRHTPAPDPVRRRPEARGRSDS